MSTIKIIPTKEIINEKTGNKKTREPISFNKILDENHLKIYEPEKPAVFSNDYLFQFVNFEINNKVYKLEIKSNNTESNKNTEYPIFSRSYRKSTSELTIYYFLQKLIRNNIFCTMERNAELQSSSYRYINKIIIFWLIIWSLNFNIRTLKTGTNQNTREKNKSCNISKLETIEKEYLNSGFIKITDNYYFFYRIVPAQEYKIKILLMIEIDNEFLISMRRQNQEIIFRFYGIAKRYMKGDLNQDKLKDDLMKFFGYKENQKNRKTVEDLIKNVIDNL